MFTAKQKWQIVLNFNCISFIFQITTILGTSESSLSGWKKTPTQYHIQTDEGEERFFKFQTFNGQYRKERRLDDGTVIGSYGWVDPTGYLRMTDYIADSKGYRVVKELKEYVGQNSIMEDTPSQKYSPPPKKHSIKVAKPPNVFFANIKDTTTANPFLEYNAVSVTPEPLIPTSFVSTSPKNNLYYPEPGKNGAPHKVFLTSDVGPGKPVPLNSIFYYPEESRNNATFSTPSAQLSLPIRTETERNRNRGIAVPVATFVPNSRFPGRRPPVQIFRQTNSGLRRVRVNFPTNTVTFSNNHNFLFNDLIKGFPSLGAYAHELLQAKQELKGRVGIK